MRIVQPSPNRAWIIEWITQSQGDVLHTLEIQNSKLYEIPTELIYKEVAKMEIPLQKKNPTQDHPHS